MIKPLTRLLVTASTLFAFNSIPVHAQDDTAPGNLMANGTRNITGPALGIALSFPAASLTGSASTVNLDGSAKSQIWLSPCESGTNMVFDPATMEITINVPPTERHPGVWSTSGSNAILTSGNVGIGAIRPAYSLDVLGTFRIQDANGSYIRSWSNENTWLGFKSSMGDANFYVQGRGGHQWVLSGGQAHGWEGGFQIYDQTVQASRFSIDTSGNISIGASTIKWDGRSYNPNIPPLYVASSGSVGIGTASPQAPLDITSTINDKYAIRFSPYAYNNYNLLDFFDGDGSLHGQIDTNYSDALFKLGNVRSGYGLFQWDNGAMAYASDEHYRNISSQPFYIDTDRSVHIGAGGGSLHVTGQFILSGTSLSPNRISNGGLVVTGSEVTSGTTTTIVSTGTNQLALIPQQGDLSMGSFTAGAQPK